MNLKTLLNILNPQPNIGALEISDVDLKFIGVKENKLISYSVKLAAGTVRAGKILNRENFLSALAALYSQINQLSPESWRARKKKISIIVNIPDNAIYFQVFNLPALEHNLEEAIELNLKMISPIDFSAAYSDWQSVGEEVVNGHAQSEILGAFAEAKMIDEIDDCLKISNFVPAAFEFNGLALVRLAVEYGANIDKNKPFLLLNVGSGGLSFNLARKGNIYFNHFVSWQTTSAETREISIDVFKKIIIDEIKKVFSFYGGRWKDQISDIVLVSHGLDEAIMKIISENFSFIKIQPLALSKIGNISTDAVQPAWFSALGSVIRGMIPRSRDNIISLAKTGTQEEFFQHQKLGFIKFWRNSIAAILAIILIVFGGTDFFLAKTAVSLNNRAAEFGGLKQPEQEEFNKLKKEIENYNNKISFAEKVYGERSKMTEFFEKINNLAADGNIAVKRIYIQSLEAPVLINASASNEDAAVSFKNKLIEDGKFRNVNLPITKISRTDKGVEFTVSFNIK